MSQIITSLLDTDLYKFTMHQFIFHKHKQLKGKYFFDCRNENITFSQEIFDEINNQIDALCNLTFKSDEIEYLRSLNIFAEDYLDFLSIWKPNRNYISISLEKGKIELTIEGPIYDCTLFETYLMSIINECYYNTKNYPEIIKSAWNKLETKIKKFNNGTYNFKFAEFGTRRRLSKTWQEIAFVNLLYRTNALNGTSNVYLSKKFNLTPIGAMAHEIAEIYQIYSPLTANHDMIKDWLDEFRGKFSVIVTDTLTTNQFLKEFNYQQMDTCIGLRNDSGDPYEWGEKIINYYNHSGIDTSNKTLLFSNNLSFDEAQKIKTYFKDKNINVGFGIGTQCSNDTMAKPLNIVIKLQYVDEKPVAKISDNFEKVMCQDDEYLEELKSLVL